MATSQLPLLHEPLPSPAIISEDGGGPCRKGFWESDVHHGQHCSSESGLLF